MSKCYALSVVLSINDNKYNAQYTNYHLNTAVRFAVSYKYIMLFFFLPRSNITIFEIINLLQFGHIF